MSYANWLLRGTNSAGRIYAVDSTATTVLFNYNNDAKGLAEAIQLALRCYPEISSTGTYDSQVGVRFYINPTAGSYGNIAGATEITQFIIPQQTVTTTGTILAGVLTLGRLARTMIVEVDAGGVGVTLNTLTVTGAQSGDSVTLYAKGGTSFTVNMGGGNMYSGNTDADYTSTSVKNRITVTYNGTNWDDNGRVEQNAVSVTDLRAASIPQSPTGVTSIALVNGGATNTLLAQTNSHVVRLTGSGYNLTGNNNFNGGGTPIEGDTFTIFGNGATCSYAGGGNILVQGETVPTDMAANGWWVATLAYMSAAWVCTAIVPDFTQSQFIVTSQIKDLNVTTGKVNDLAITTGKINDLAVTNAKIANATIDASTKLVDGSIDMVKLDPTLQGMLGSNIITTKITIPSASVLTLNAAPIQLVAAPGAGYCIQVITCVGRIVFAGVAYATNTTLRIYEDAAGQALASNSLLLAAGSTRIQTIGTQAPTSNLTEFMTENSALMIRVDTGNPTLGTSDLEIYLTYRIITL